jgi:hypothetical protein
VKQVGEVCALTETGDVTFLLLTSYHIRVIIAEADQCVIIAEVDQCRADFAHLSHLCTFLR